MRLGLLLSGICTPHQRRSRTAGAGERDPRAPGAGPGRGSSHTWLLHRECAPGLSGVCVLLPPVQESPLCLLLLQGDQLGDLEELEKHKADEKWFDFLNCYDFEGNLGPTFCFLESTVLKSSTSVWLNVLLKYSDHFKMSILLQEKTENLFTSSRSIYSLRSHPHPIQGMLFHILSLS